MCFIIWFTEHLKLLIIVHEISERTVIPSALGYATAFNYPCAL